MMTHRSGEQAAMFEFARRLIDPDFRRTLHDLGTVNEQDIIVAVNDMPTTQVFDQVFTRSRPPAVIAIHRPVSRHGFVFLMARPGVHHPDQPSQDRIFDIRDTTTIGELYDELTGQAASLEVASRWSYDVRPYAPALTAA